MPHTNCIFIKITRMSYSLGKLEEKDKEADQRIQAQSIGFHRHLYGWSHYFWRCSHKPTIRLISGPFLDVFKPKFLFSLFVLFREGRGGRIRNKIWSVVKLSLSSFVQILSVPSPFVNSFTRWVGKKEVGKQISGGLKPSQVAVVSLGRVDARRRLVRLLEVNHPDTCLQIMWWSGCDLKILSQLVFQTPKMAWIGILTRRIMMKMLVKFLVTFVSSWTKSKELPINSWEEKKGEPMQRSWINFKRSKYMSCKF